MKNEDMKIDTTTTMEQQRPGADNISDVPGHNTINPSGELSNEEFEAFLRKEVGQHPLSEEYPDVFAKAPKLICSWRKRYRGNSSIWKRLFDKDRVMKEFIEAAPIIDAVQRFVLNSEECGEKFTIVDLACGRGYLSMLLSELLPPEKVERFVLVDKQWAMHGMKPGPQHISWSHIYGSVKAVEDQSMPRYYDTWPISLNTSKVDLKKSKEIKSLEQGILRDKGPVLLLAVHLCGTLSLKAVDLFNNNPEVKFFCLKPCCLPGLVHAKREEIFHLGSHSFDSKLVCLHGKWKKNVWVGPSRTATRAYFDRWADNLFLGIDATESAKIKRKIMVQQNGGYQNEFLFAERLPETSEVWDQLRAKEQSPGNENCATIC